MDGEAVSVEDLGEEVDLAAEDLDEADLDEEDLDEEAEVDAFRSVLGWRVKNFFGSEGLR